MNQPGGKKSRYYHTKFCVLELCVVWVHFRPSIKVAAWWHGNLGSYMYCTPADRFAFGDR